MSDNELLSKAIEATGLSVSRFSVEVIGVERRTVHRWLAGDREMPQTIRIVLRAICDRPGLAADLRNANANVATAGTVERV